ncbi:MAG: carboxypeptidase-like regulatory domain-containing protein, partial [Vicinamibacterales bacterium]
MLRYQRLAVLVVSVVLLPVVAWAQGSIAGVVRDTSGAVMPGVTVEASSAALIEKVRSVVTDGTGQYQIVDLRPGTYTVTFTLTGFSVVKREGIELTGSFAATVNADLKVGSLEETVTVSGESPTVDIQSSRRSNVIPTEVIDALPTSRSQYTMAVLLPGALRAGGGAGGIGVQDVGGTRTMQITTFSIHGSRAADQRLMLNGLTARNFLSSAWASNFVPDMGTAAEVVLDYATGTADSYAAGIGINVIPKEGGNRFTGSIFATGASGAFQGNNYSPELAAAGLTSPNKLHRVYDINPAAGGPIIRDKLWFFGTMRWQESSFFQAGAFANKNGGDLSKWTYEPDFTKPGKGILTVNPSWSARLTWQATPRNKIGFSYEPQNRN